MTVRIAAINDMEQICSLYRQMNFEIAALQRLDSFNIEPDRERVKQQICSDNCILLVAEGATQMLNGFIYIKLKDFITDASATIPIALIKAYYARRNEQREETLHSLLHAADEWAKSRSAQQLAVTILAQDGFALGMYEKQGFETAARVMCRKIV